MSAKVLRNRARCRKCNTEIESKHVHHFVQCTCKSIFVDGGTEYIRRGGDFNVMEDLSEVQDD